MGKLITPGELAPGFELPDVDGKSVRLIDFRGKPVLLSFLRGFM
jgi:peroxiredoxin